MRRLTILGLYTGSCGNTPCITHSRAFRKRFWDIGGFLIFEEFQMETELRANFSLIKSSQGHYVLCPEQLISPDMFKYYVAPF